MSDITIDELLPIIDKVNLIDIRNAQSYNNNHIDGAINIPYEKLIIKPSAYLIPTNKYYIYCQKGIMSKKVCQILSQLGYNVVHITGGYEEWILKK